MGLREEKKLRVRGALIENAIALFRDRGFEATRVQDIARPLDLSDATFFNYFATKDAVLSEWVRDLVDAAFGEAAGARSGRMRSEARAAARWLAECIERDAEFLGPLWHRVRQGAGSGSLRVRESIAQGQARGELRGDLPARQLGDLLVAGLLVEIGAWLSQPDRALGGLASRLQGSVDLVLDGSRKRNERVRPPVGSGATGPSRSFSGAPE